jgi:cytochrome c-type biogenesis protein CcmH
MKKDLRSRPTWLTGALLLLLLACFLAPAAARAADKASLEQPPATGEVTLERRLFAPCCWNQTLDVHESDLATSLRREIRARLHAGDSQGTIEDDLASRYGERIRAVERGHDPGGAMPFLVGFAALFAAASLVALLRRWRRAGNAARSSEGAKASEAEVVGGPEDIRLDAELRALDE